jgi:hypothetical protein
MLDIETVAFALADITRMVMLDPAEFKSFMKTLKEKQVDGRNSEYGEFWI